MNMEISARDKKLLVYLLAVSIIAAAYYFVARPMLDKISNLTLEAEQLQLEVNQLLSIYNNQESYTTRIAEEQVRFNEALQKFPSNLTQENTLMMLDDIEKNTGAWISRVSFTEEEISSGGGEETTDTVDEMVEEAEDLANNSEEEDSESGEVGETTISAGSLLRVQQNLSLEYSCSYSNFKKFVEYVANYKDRLYISNINALYSVDSNEVSGTLMLSQYAVYGTGKEFTEPDLQDVSLGTDNIFTTLAGTPGNIGTASDDNDSSVELSTLVNPEAQSVSIFMKLNPADTGDEMIVIGKSGDVSEETYVKTSKNDSSIVEIMVSGSDGSYTVTEKISDNENTFEMESEGDIKLEILSFNRENSGDKVEAELSVANTSDKKMIVEILGDDTENPRVNIREKLGDIEIK